MKTRYREHPLGTPGLGVRLEDEPSEPTPPPSLVRRARRFLARLGSRLGLR